MRDLTEKINCVECHLREHPNDWQTKISYLKIKGRQLDYEDRLAMTQRLKRIAEIRKEIVKEELENIKLNN